MRNGSHAANEELVESDVRFGFRRVSATGLRLFLPAASLREGPKIQEREISRARVVPSIETSPQPRPHVRHDRGFQ